ncbi:MAG: hypothetical protein WCK84_05685 [Bacteroidota bacterium]
MAKETKEKKSIHLRFAVMCNGTVFQQWQVDALKELKAHGHELVLLIRDVRENREIKHGRRIQKIKWSNFLFYYLEKRFFKPKVKNLVDIFKDLEGIDTLPCTVERLGYSEYFPSAEVEAIRMYGLDFILRFGFNIIRGDILSAARFGVWSFHHDDELKYRGGPAGFWEIFDGDPVSGAILQRLTDKLDGGIILKKGYIKTVMHSYKGNLHQLFSVTSSWPAQVADEILLFPADFVSSSETTAPVYKVPGNYHLIQFVLKLLWNRIRFYYKELVAAEVWNVGLIQKPIHEVALGPEILKKSDITWLRQFARTKYLADPSGFIENGKLHILVEDYSYRRQKANISEIIWDINRDSFSVPIRIIEGDKHLSYPYIVRHQQMVYCVPESFRSSNITLYYRNFSEEAFIEDHLLLDKVEAVDPTLFFHDGYWWLFFTIKKYSTTHLYIYYSNELKGRYEPHRRNPVKIDIRSARPAGTPFIYEGILYRPAQDCSVTYGGRVVINKVLRLTTDEFVEQTIRVIDSVPGSPFDKGLHTMSQVGNYTLIDGKRYRINRFFFMSQLREKLNKQYPENGQ